MNAPSEQPTISLRQVISAFPKKSKSKQRDHAPLRDLLANGDLKAGFYCCNRWVSIPKNYWRDNVSDKKFQTILRSKTDRRLSGSYRVRIATFYAQYLELLQSEHNSKDKEPLLREMAQALAHSSERYEVRILETEWETFCKNKPNLLHQESRGPGRHQIEQWREVAIILAAYGMQVSAEPWRDFKTSAVEKYINKQAAEIGAKDLPKTRSIAVVLAEARKLAKGSKG